MKARRSITLNRNSSQFLVGNLVEAILPGGYRTGVTPPHFSTTAATTTVAAAAAAVATTTTAVTIADATAAGYENSTRFKPAETAESLQ